MPFFFALIALLFLPTSINAAQCTGSGSGDCHAYVNTDYGSCTSPAGSTADPYCSLSQAISQEASNIVTNGYDAVYIHLKGVTAADTTATTVSGWTTGASNILVLMTDNADTDSDLGTSASWDTGGRNEGATWSDSHYRLAPTCASANTNALNIAENFIEIVGLQIFANGSSTYDCYTVNFGSISGSGVGKLSYSRMRGPNSALSGNTGFVAANDSGWTTYIWNSISYDMISSGSGYERGFWGITGAAIYAYNNTVAYTGDGGFYEQTITTAVVYHNYQGEEDTANVDWSGGAWTGDYNVQETTDAHCPSCTNSIPMNTSNFTDPAAADRADADFSLPSGSSLIDVEGGFGNQCGAGNCSPPWNSTNYTDDIMGNTRDASAYDAGAFEYVSAAAPAARRVILIQ